MYKYIYMHIYLYARMYAFIYVYEYICCMRSCNRYGYVYYVVIITRRICKCTCVCMVKGIEQYYSYKGRMLQREWDVHGNASSKLFVFRKYLKISHIAQLDRAYSVFSLFLSMYITFCVMLNINLRLFSTQFDSNVLMESLQFLLLDWLAANEKDGWNFKPYLNRKIASI